MASFELEKPLFRARAADGSSAWRGHLAVLVQVSIFGVWYVVARNSVDGGKASADPFAMIAVRSVLSMAGVNLYLGEWPRLNRRLVVLGMLMGSTQTLFMVGSSLTSAQVTGMMAGVGPVCGVILPAALGEERFSWVKVLAGVLSAGSVGALFFVREQELAWSGAFVLGVLCLVAQEVVVVGQNMITKAAVCNDVTPLQILAAASCSTAVYAWTQLAVVTFLGREMDFALLLEPPAVCSISYAVILVTCVGQTLKAIGLRHLSTSTTTAYSAVIPVFSVLLAAATLHEPLTAEVIGSLIGVVAAVFLASSQKDRDPEGSRSDRDPRLGPEGGPSTHKIVRASGRVCMC
jgi:drug/metabolite transporter (DMT)-like permease